jgi:hypothetical protein
MRGFEDVLKDGFEQHARAVAAKGGVDEKRARTMLVAIRHRRVLNTTVAASATVIVAGALAAGAVKLTSTRPEPGGTVNPVPTPTTYAYPWCDLSTYPAVNTAALGDYGYEGRIYSDYNTNVNVYVAPDGTHHVLEPDADGYYTAVAPDGSPITALRSDEVVPRSGGGIALDFYGQGAAGGTYYLDPTSGPGLAYEWTTVVPDDVPQGVSTRLLSQVHSLSLGFGGSGLSRSAVPAGSVVQSVIRWTDGREQVVDIGWDSPGASLSDYTGIESISLRVSNLPDGQTFEITSTYDPTMTWAAACGTDSLAAPSPTPSMPAFNYGAYFEGPEAAVFSCLAPIPPELENAIPTTVETGVGEEYWTEQGLYLDYGTGGAKITSVLGVWTMTGDSEPAYPGWRTAGTIDVDGLQRGSIGFDALAWIDASGRIIGREVAEPDVSQVLIPESDTEVDLGEVDGQDTVTAVRGNLASRGVSCDGIDASALANATVVYIQGAGPDAEHMTWSWTRIWPTE